MTKEIYTVLFDYYEIPKFDDTKNRRIRKVIRERLAKAYPAREWDELTELEKQTFKLVTMKDYLIRESRNDKKVEKRIKSELENTLYKANIDLSEHNKHYEILHKQFYDTSAPEDVQQKSYNEFCSYIKEWYPNEDIPSFEEWKTNPIRLYDIEQRRLEEIRSSYYNNNSDESVPITQAEIDHVALECLIIIIERELQTSIDLKSIKHCLNIEHEADRLNINEENLQSEFDPSLPASEDEQKRRIEFNLDFMQSLKKLEEHDFIIKKEGKP